MDNALPPSAHSVALAAWHLVAVFFERHWLVGLVNAVATAGLGLGLLWPAGRLWPLSAYPSAYLQIKRLVLLIALFKGALYLVLGVSLQSTVPREFGCGFQLAPIQNLVWPSIASLIWPHWPSGHSIWNPTAATYAVTLVLVGTAVVLLARRAYRVATACRTLEAFKRMTGLAEPRVQAILQRAATAIGLPAEMELPAPVVVDLDCATPLLLGISRPLILVSPALIAVLTDEELELAFRHELAHLKRRDHWWRWLILWVEDIGGPMMLARRLTAWSIEMEEQLCDRLAVATAADASYLAKAIAKAAGFVKGHAERVQATELPPDLSQKIALPAHIVPALLGAHHLDLSESATIKRRVQALLSLSEELSEADVPTASSTQKNRLPLWRILLDALALVPLALLFLGVLYAKFYVFFLGR